MALTVGARGQGGDNAGGTSTTISPLSDLTLGSLGVICIALDNAGAAGNAAAAPTTATDSVGNIWTRRMNGWFDNGAASAGVEIAIYTSSILKFRTTDTLTLSWISGVTVTAKAWTCYDIIPGSGFSAVFSDQAAGTGGTNTGGTVTTNSIPSGNVVIGMAGLEGADSWSGDADTSNGSWQAQSHTGFGTGLTGMSVTSQNKIVTGTATQTYNPTCTSGDTMIGWASFTEVVNPNFQLETTTDQRADASRLRTIATNSLFFVNLALTLYAPLQPPGVQNLSQPLKIVRYQPAPQFQNLLQNTLAPAVADSTNIFPAPLYVRPQYVRRIQDSNPVNLLGNTLGTVPPIDVLRDLQVTKIIQKFRRQQTDIPPNLLSSTLAVALPPVDVFRELQVTKISYPKRRFQESYIQTNRLVPDFTAEYTVRGPILGSQPVRRIKVQTPFQYPNILISILSIAPTAIQNRQNDWQNPVRRIYRAPVDGPIHTLGIQINTKPFHQDDWPNPNRLKYNAPVDQVINNRTALTPAVQPPFHQDDWQNPILRKYRAPVDGPIHTLGIQINTKPFKLDEYQNPTRTRQVQTDIPPNLMASTLFVAPVTGTDIFPAPLYVPRIIRRQVQDAPQPNTIQLVSQPNVKPNHQDDWQNPVRRKYAQPVYLPLNLSPTLPEEVHVIVIIGSQAWRRKPVQRPFEFPNTISLVSAPNPKPNHQDDWQNPVRRKYSQPVDGPSSLQALNTPPPVAAPFHQDDWQNPVRRVTRAPVDAPVHTLGIQINTKPFKQDDWQNPILNKYRAPVDGPTNILAVFLTAPPPPTPFHQDDWPNPVRRTWRAPVDGPVNTLDITINRKPFDQSDWQNPRLRKFDARFDGPTNLLKTLLAPAPFHQDDWPNPVRRIYRAPVDGPVSLLGIFINAKPFKYDDWQNPVRRKYCAPVDQILNSEAALFTTPIQPDTEGLEYTVITERLHYTVKSHGQAQFTSEAQRLGYTLRDEDHL